MSDKRPDERDIDEILASIDEMLSQKEPYSLQTDTRKDSVKEGVKASENKLGLSSSVDAPEISEFDHIDIEDFLSLGIQDAQPTDTSKTKTEEHKAEEQSETSLKLENGDVLATNKDANKGTTENVDKEIDQSINFTLNEADFPDFDEIHSSNQEPNAGGQETQTPEISANHDDTPLPPATTSQKPTDKHINDDLSQDGLLESDPVENEISAEHQEDEAVTEDNASTPRHRILLTEELLEPCAQEALPLWIEQNSAEEEQAEITTDTEPTAETEEHSTVEKHKLPIEAEEYTPIQPVQNTQDIFSDVAANIAKNEAITFDLEENIAVDTVYKLETLVTTSDDDLDNHTELVEVMMEEVLQDDDEQPQTTEEQPEKEIKKVFLSDEELQNMVQAVSSDVAQQINDHLQTWLPGLISIAIKNHMKDLNNKD